MVDERISVFLADDNLIVREGVRALLGAEPDIEVVGVAADRAELIAGADETEPQVLVTDIRMPPDFRREGIEAAQEVRKRHPGTGVVILSQYEQPEYAISLLREGAMGCAYLLKDCVADGDQLARAVREVATGGSMLDPRIVQALVSPVTERGGLTSTEEELLELVAEGRPIKAIAAARETAPATVADDVETLFRKLAEGASAGVESSLEWLRMLHSAIVEREHGPPLAYASCNPPQLESGRLTVGAPDSNSHPVNSIGFVRYRVQVGTPGGVDDADVSFTMSLTDVRRQGTFADYTGELQAAAVARITDRINGPSVTEPSTVTDVPFPVTVPCTATGGTADIGATCAITTSLDAVMPGAIPEGKRVVWGMQQLKVYDGGPDDDVDTAPNTLFAVQGIFVP